MTEPNEYRRQQDRMLSQILVEQGKILTTLNEFRIEHADLYGRLETRVDAIERTTQELEKVVRAHETWINTSKGKTSVIGAVFGVLGSLVGVIVDHFLTHR